LKKILSMLSIAQKAGYIGSGEFQVEKSVKGRKSYLVIVASDASDNTNKKFTNMCKFYNVPMYLLSDKEELGHAIGKQIRSSLSVNNKGMADAINNLIMAEIARD